MTVTSSTFSILHKGDESLWTSDLRWLAESRLRYVLKEWTHTIESAVVQLWPEENKSIMVVVILHINNGPAITSSVTNHNVMAALCVACDRVRSEIDDMSMLSA